MFKSFKNIFKFIGKAFFTSNTEAVHSMGLEFSDGLDRFETGLRLKIRQINKIGEIIMKRLMKEVKQMVKDFNNKFDVKPNAESYVDFGSELPESLDDLNILDFGDLDERDIFDEDMEETCDAEIEFTNDTPSWVDEAHKNEMVVRSRKQILEELMYNTDDSEDAEVDVAKEVKKGELKSYFMKRKIDNVRTSSNTLKNKPNGVS
jgi:hypothetical protein